MIVWWIRGKIIRNVWCSHSLSVHVITVTKDPGWRCV